MWVEKQSWIYHGEGRQCPILSIDVQPLMERFITGSMDSSINVWNFKGIVDPDEKELKLATLSQHCGPVNCVRWNPNTQTFASGSDDKFIIIWELKDGGLSDNIEEWRACLTLQGHQSDIKDLNWNRTGKMLASGSIDNTVIIWNVEKSQFFPYQILKGHESYVTSVAFDPFDKKLASLGEDKKLIIWDTTEWKMIKTYEQSLAHNASQVMKRLSFTPDGRNLVLPGPKQSSYRFMASVLNLEDYQPSRYLSGHLQPVSIVSACPVLYRSSNEKGFSWVVACGGFDSAISIWKSGETRPIAIRDLFRSAVTDLSWSSNGKFLLACSNDGTVATIYLAGELGEVATQVEMNNFIYELYSEIPPVPVIQHTFRKTASKKCEPQPMNEQKEIRLQNGKRRIQPVLLSTPGQDAKPQFSQSARPVVQNLTIISSPNAPNLPMLETQGIEFSLSFTKVLCSANAADFTEGLVNTNLLHVSSLINTSGDIILEAFSCELEGYQSAILLRKGNKQLWKNLLPHKVSIVSGSAYFAAIYTEEGYLYCYTIGGIQCLPEMKVDNGKLMESCDHFLGILCKDNDNSVLYLYNLELKKEVIRCKIENIDVKSLELTSTGTPKIESKSGEIFIYDADMGRWLRIKSSGLEYYKCDGWNPGELTSTAASFDLDTFSTLKIPQIEMQLVRLMYLKDKGEYNYTVKKYVNMLLDYNESYKLMDLLHTLQNKDNELYKEVQKIIKSYREKISQN